LSYHSERAKALKQRKERPQPTRRGAPDERRDEGKNHTEKLSVHFSEGEAFGNFCVLLDKEHISFGLAGFQTVIIAKKDLDHLSDACAAFYQRCLREGSIKQVVPTPLVGSRYLPTLQEAEKLLQQLAEEF
jgi:hypothetical protein